MATNKVKPTKKQRQTFKHMEKALTLREAMIKGGYSAKSALNPRQNFVDRRGTQELLKQYRGHLINAGITPELLAEVQAEGLFDQNAAVRLGYLKETKKDFGLIQDDSSQPIQINNIIGAKRDEYAI